MIVLVARTHHILYLQLLAYIIDTTGLETARVKQALRVIRATWREV